VDWAEASDDLTLESLSPSGMSGMPLMPLFLHCAKRHSKK
jgi:hypothetical protein